MPLFRNESQCKTFHIETGLTCTKMNGGAHFPMKGFFTKTRIDTEAKGNLSVTLGTS